MRQRALTFISLFAGVAGAVALSAQVTATFKAESQRLVEAGRATQLARGFTEREMLRIPLLTPFTVPGPTIQKVLPGGMIAVSVRGDFPAGTTILSERDGVTMSGATLTTATYSARLTIPPDEGPGFVRLWAFTPTGIRGPRAVGLVETLYRFDLRSPNGYTVKIAPVEKTFTIRDNITATVKYQAEFYKPGETTPFETATGDQTFSVDDAPHESHTPYARLDLAFDQSATSPQAEIDAITQRMNDPQTTDTERNALLVRMAAVQRKMLEEMTKALQTDPASLNKKQDDFGCASLQLYPSKGGAVEGSFMCGQNFNDGVLKVAGTMTQVR